jgi:serine protease Do
MGYQDMRLGMTVDDMSPEFVGDLGYSTTPDGVFISHIRADSPAAKKGLCAGMVLLRIDNEPVTSKEDYQRIMKQQSLNQGILMLVAAPGRKHFVVLRP